MIAFVHPHRLPRLRESDLDSFSFEQLNEDHRRSETTVIDDGSRPIENDRLQRPAIRTLKHKIHQFPSFFSTFRE